VSLTLMPYPKYKSSALKSLGQIPSHWSELRAKYLFREVDDRSVTGTEEMLSVSHITGVTPRSEKNVTMFLAESNVGHKCCREKDLVINTMWAWMGALGVSRYSGLVSPSYGVYRPFDDRIDPPFLDALLRTSSYVGEYTARSTGVNSSRLRLYPDRFLSLPVLLPPTDEQIQISSFIRRVSVQIQMLIRAKRRVIELLNEQKQVIIQRAFEEGIDPDVDRKTSHIWWLPEIPAHWNMLRLKDVMREPLTNGLFKRSDAFGAGVKLINVGDIFSETLRITPGSLDRVQASPDEIERFRAIAGDIFFVRSSLKLEGTGRCAYLEDSAEDTVFECHVVRCRSNRALIYPLFLTVWLNSWTGRHLLISRANTVTMSTLPQGAIDSIPVPVPPLSEQLLILEHLDVSLRPIMTALTSASREIDLLREYRMRLIADVVTGRLDVRRVASPELNDVEDVADVEVEELEDSEEAVAVEENTDAD